MPRRSLCLAVTLALAACASPPSPPPPTPVSAAAAPDDAPRDALPASPNYAASYWASPPCTDFAAIASSPFPTDAGANDAGPRETKEASAKGPTIYPPWHVPAPDRWANALDGYRAAITPDRTLLLDSAVVPFAAYINQMHSQIHPLFSGSFLGWLDSRPETDRMNSAALYTRVEMVIDRNGHLTRMGIVGGTGERAFEMSVLEAIDRAQPFGATPAVIQAPDGQVYLQWIFYRDRRCGCSSTGARPFLLR
jgi:TonB family protein